MLVERKSEIAYYIQGDFAYSIWLTPLGTLCGYLGVPPSHPWWGKWYGDIDCEVHGGLTYSSWEDHGLRMKILFDGKEELPIEYPRTIDDDFWSRFEYPKIDKPQPPYPHDTGLNLYWVGFDCAHIYDTVPGAPYKQEARATYKNEEYVRNELIRLASQAAEAYRRELPERSS